MTQYSMEARTRKHVKGYGFLLFARKHKKNSRVRCFKNYFKKVVHKAAEATGEKQLKQQIKRIKASIVKMEHYKISKLWTLLVMGWVGVYFSHARFFCLLWEHHWSWDLDLTVQIVVFSKHLSKTTRRQNSQNKDNRTNWGPEFFVIYWSENVIIFFLIIYQILLSYFFCFSFCNWYYLKKNFVLLNF